MQWQIPGIAALQTWNALDGFWRAVTWLGNEEFYLLLIPLLYLGVSPRLGLRLGLLVLLGDALNNVIKLACGLPRPYWLNSAVRPLATEASYGFPSSHAQNAVSVWFFLASVRPRARKWIVASVLVLLISLSRVYLGVHFFTDILGGWIIGALFLLAFLKWEPAARAKFETGKLPTQLFAATALALGVILLGVLANSLPARGAEYSAFAANARSLEALVSRAGALWGLLIGCAMTLRYAQFAPHEKLGKRIAALVLGVAGVLVLWRGLAVIFPREPETVSLFFRFVRYALMTWWVVFLAPWILLRLKLAAPAKANGALEVN